jgi:threonine/homoserine efflux transporter RhtA
MTAMPHRVAHAVAGVLWSSDIAATTRVAGTIDHVGHFHTALPVSAILSVPLRQASEGETQWA